MKRVFIGICIFLIGGISGAYTLRVYEDESGKLLMHTLAAMDVFSLYNVSRNGTLSAVKNEIHESLCANISNISRLVNSKSDLESEPFVRESLEVILKEYKSDMENEQGRRCKNMLGIIKLESFI